jgi:hypothetical protein
LIEREQKSYPYNENNKINKKEKKTQKEKRAVTISIKVNNLKKLK